MCNFLEYKGGFLRTRNPFPYPADQASLLDSKVVYRRYASLFFIAGCASTDNELITLEVVHRYVEQMDKYYGNVCELDIIFNFQKAYFILDELLIAGEMQETSKKNVLRCISQQDSLEDMEVSLPVPILHHTRGHSVTTLSLSLQRRRKDNVLQYPPSHGRVAAGLTSPG
jgi:hypothetical protein